MKTSAPPPTYEEAPGSLREATVSANLAPRPLWPIPWPTPSTPFLGPAFLGALRAPRSSPGSSSPSPPPCLLPCSPRPTTDDGGGEIARRLPVAAPLSPRGPTPWRPRPWLRARGLRCPPGRGAYVPLP